MSLFEKHKELIERAVKANHERTYYAAYPEKLVEIPINACCPPEYGSIVLDPFLGSGTTALVASKLNRKFIGIELCKEYVQMSHKRLEPYLHGMRA